MAEPIQNVGQSDSFNLTTQIIQPDVPRGVYDGGRREGWIYLASLYEVSRANIGQILILIQGLVSY